MKGKISEGRIDRQRVEGKGKKRKKKEKRNEKIISQTTIKRAKRTKKERGSEDECGKE